MSTLTIYVRAAGPEDFAAINHLVEQMDWLHIEWYPEYFQPQPHGETRPAAWLRTYVDRKDADILLAFDQAGLVGVSMVQVERPADLPLLRHAPRVAIHNLVVEAQQRGRGIGHELLRASQDWAEERGIFEVQLTVYESNEQARQFYEQEGFEPLNTTYRLRW